MSAIDDNFEPQQGSGNYLKITEGTHRVRILAPAISGYGWWTETPEGGKKPQRIPMDGRPPVEYAESVKKFLAFAIWNYTSKRIQVLEVTQPSIQRDLKALDKDADWGDLVGYDVEFIRTGTGKFDTKYKVTPKPKAKLSEEIVNAVGKNGLPVLEALFKGGDPFNSTKEEDEITEEDQAKIDAIDPAKDPAYDKFQKSLKEE